MKYNIYIYLLFFNLNTNIAGLGRISTKEREKKERQVRREKKRKGLEAH